jgi:hypothetical protein
VRPRSGTRRLLQIGNGNLRWARDLSAGAGVGGDGRRVFAVDAKSNVVAFSTATGANAWRQEKLPPRPHDPAGAATCRAGRRHAGYAFLSLTTQVSLRELRWAARISATPCVRWRCQLQTQDGTVALNRRVIGLANTR